MSTSCFKFTQKINSALHGSPPPLLPPIYSRSACSIGVYSKRLPEMVGNSASYSFNSLCIEYKQLQNHGEFHASICFPSQDTLQTIIIFKYLYVSVHRKWFSQIQSHIQEFPETMRFSSNNLLFSLLIKLPYSQKILKDSIFKHFKVVCLTSKIVYPQIFSSHAQLQLQFTITIKQTASSSTYKHDCQC